MRGAAESGQVAEGGGGLPRRSGGRACCRRGEGGARGEAEPCWVGCVAGSRGRSGRRSRRPPSDAAAEDGRLAALTGNPMARHLLVGAAVLAPSHLLALSSRPCLRSRHKTSPVRVNLRSSPPHRPLHVVTVYCSHPPAHLPHAPRVSPRAQGVHAVQAQRLPALPGPAPGPVPRPPAPRPRRRQAASTGSTTCTADAAEAALLSCCGSRRWARLIADHRPYPDLDALLAAGDEAATT